MTQIICTRPKQIGPDQNDCYTTKVIWSVQNNFGTIEGRGINLRGCFQYRPISVEVYENTVNLTHGILLRFIFGQICRF